MQHPSTVAQVVRDKNISKICDISSIQDIETTLELLDSCNERVLLRDVYTRLLDLESSNGCSVSRDQLAQCLLEFLPIAPYLTDLFFRSSTWKSHKKSLESRFDPVANTLLEGLVLHANTMPGFIRSPLRVLLQELSLISVQNLAKIIELVTLAIRDAETALDLLLEVIEPETSRLLAERPKVVSQCVRSLIGVALDHIDEAGQGKKAAGESLQLAQDGWSDGFDVVKATIRVDSPFNKMLKTGDHVRLTASNVPQNAPFAKPYTMDALVVRADHGAATLRCIHRPPPYLEDCRWNLTYCGSFVTTKTMLDALSTFYTEKASCCRLFSSLLGLDERPRLSPTQSALPYHPHKNLNDSQNRALQASMESPLTFLWGPPGTGKTHTIVVILTQLLKALSYQRVLVAAPTHNAVDNILSKFIREDGVAISGVTPLRVSTSVGVDTPLPLFLFQSRGSILAASNCVLFYSSDSH